MTKILIIEDNTQLRENISDALELEGFEVINAEDGTSGIKQANENFPDLILCDIMMPGLNGYEVLQTLRSKGRDVLVPFILITALAERLNFREGMELGADDYLVKPFTIDELLKAINTRLAKHESIETRIKYQIEIIENELRSRIKELNDQIESQKKFIKNITDSNDDVVELHNEGQAQLMQESIRTIEINTTIQNMVRLLSVELQKTTISSDQRIMLTSLKNRIHNKSVLSNSLTAFQLKFNQTYPNFTTRLFTEFPNLTQQDIILISAIFLNLTTKQLSSIFGISLESVRKSKYRLKKKMGFEKDEDLAKSIHGLRLVD